MHVLAPGHERQRPVASVTVVLGLLYILFHCFLDSHRQDIVRALPALFAFLRVSFISNFYFRFWRRKV